MMRKRRKENNSCFIGAALFFLFIFCTKFHVYAAAGAPEDGNVYNGHTYQTINQSMSWEDAQKYCESLGGHLVTVTSNGENAYISTLAKDAGRNCYWIGLFSKYGKWNWVTDEPVNYTNWTANEPNNFEKKGEVYAHLFGKPWKGSGSKYIGEWNDVSNSGAEYANQFYALENFGFICEWDSVWQDDTEKPDPSTPGEDIETPDPDTPDEDTLQELLDQVKVTISRKSYARQQKGKVKIRLPEDLSEDDIESVRYASSDKSIAAINKSGIVTAKKGGKAIIYVEITLTDGSSKEFSCPISVAKRRVKTGGR